jgi:hypothetical protein
MLGRNIAILRMGVLGGRGQSGSEDHPDGSGAP